MDQSINSQNIQYESLNTFFKTRQQTIDLTQMMFLAQEVEKLCKAREKVKLQIMRCSGGCKEEIPISNSKQLVIQQCGCQKEFHPICFYQWYLNNKPECKKCNVDLTDQFKTAEKIFAKKCLLCKQMLNQRDQILPANCECLNGSVHKKCLAQKSKVSGILNSILCADCNQPFSEKSAEQSVINNLYYCKRCDNNYPFKETIFLECRDTFCLSCFNYYNSSRTTKISQIKCPDASCGAKASFHDLKYYLQQIINGTKVISQYSGQADSERFENLFQFTKCKGYFQCKERGETKRISQDLITYQLTKLDSGNNQQQLNFLEGNTSNKENIQRLDDDHAFYEKDSDYQFFKPCNNIIQITLDSDTKMIKCTECGYQFCYKCTLPHFNSSHEFFENYITQHFENEDNFLNYFSSFDQSQQYHLISNLIIQIRIPKELFQIKKKKGYRQPSRPITKIRDQPYICSYPMNATYVALNFQTFYNKPYESVRTIWIPAFFPINSIYYLRLCLLVGIEPTYHPDLEYETSITSNKKLNIQLSKFYPDFNEALTLAQVIPLQNYQVKILLLCRINPNDILISPSELNTLLVRNPTSVLTYKIFIFPANQ